jgi:hypothetical protein
MALQAGRSRKLLACACSENAMSVWNRRRIHHLAIGLGAASVLALGGCQEGAARDPAAATGPVSVVLTELSAQFPELFGVERPGGPAATVPQDAERLRDLHFPRLDKIGRNTGFVPSKIQAGTTEVEGLRPVWSGPAAADQHALQKRTAPRGFRTVDTSAAVQAALDRAAATALDLFFPREVTSAVRIGDGSGADRVQIDLAPVGVKAARLRIDANVAVYDKAFVDADVLYLSSPKQLEQLFYLRSEKAPAIFRLRVSAASGVRELKLRERGIDFVDGQGRQRLRIDPPLAVDARGRKRGADFRLHGACPGAGCEIVLSLNTSGLEFPVLLDPTFRRVGIFAGTGAGSGRLSPVSILLADGRVLVAGGQNYSGGSVLSSTEIYDPRTGQWEPKASMSKARTLASAVLLQNGHVLVIGGQIDNTATCGGACGPTLTHTTEIYDPVGNSWQTGPALGAARRQATANVLPSGKVLVVGGFGCNGTIECPADTGSALVNIDAWDPTLGGNFSSLLSVLTTGRFDHTATLVPDGADTSVLIVGGSSGLAAVTDVEKVKESGGLLSHASCIGSLTTGRSLHTATLLPSLSHVVLIGGDDAAGTPTPVTDSVEIHALSSGCITGSGTTSTSVLARSQHTTTLLPGIFTNPVATPSSTTTWTLLVEGGAISSTERVGEGVTAGNTAGKIGQLVTIDTTGPSVSVQGVDGTNGTTTPAAYSRTAHIATQLATGEVLISGGQGICMAGATVCGCASCPEAAVVKAETFDPSAPNLCTLAHLPDSTGAEPRENASTALLPDGGVVLAFGSKNGTNPVASFTVLTSGSADPYTCPTSTGSESWSAFADGGMTARVHAPAMLLKDGNVYVFGGDDGTGAAIDNSHNDATAMFNGSTWSAIAPVNSNGITRVFHSVSMLKDGQVLALGGIATDGTSVFNNYRLFNSESQRWTEARPTGGSSALLRESHTATTLYDGTVLVVGGSTDGTAGNVTSSAVIVNPNDPTATGIDNTLTAMSTARRRHVAVLLPATSGTLKGKVLVAFGADNSDSPLNTSQIFDADARTWGSLVTATIARDGPMSAVVLPNGKVLVVGGETGSDEAEIFDPEAGTWSPVSFPSAATTTSLENVSAAVRLPTQQVLLAGGSNGASPINTVQVLDLGQFPPSARRSTISGFSPASVASLPQDLVVNGAGFLPVTEGSGGTASTNSSTNYPLVQFARVADGVTYHLPVQPGTVSDAAATVSLPATFMEGYYFVTVIVNGVPSLASILQVKLAPLGTDCTVAGVTCSSGNCADGFCCDSPCTATCKACNVDSNHGFCVNVPKDSQDPLTCISSGHACDGDGGCKLVLGQGCGGNDSLCVSGSCVDNVCCSTGSCSTCSRCNGSTPGTCSADVPFGTICSPNHVCNGSGSCLLQNGELCPGGDGQCATNFCTDGHCCNSRCNDHNCTTCLTGSCASTDTPVGRAACPGTGVCQGTCTNSSPDCAFHLTTPCRGQSCANSTTQVNAANCDGTGNCPSISQTGCGNFICAGDANDGGCILSCAHNTDCAPNNYCNSGSSCVGQIDGGLLCDATAKDGPAASCSTGHCADTVCCDSDCTGTCKACLSSKTAVANGTCSPISAGTDPDNECGLSWCNGSSGSPACLTTCSGDSNCKPTAFCDDRGGGPGPFTCTGDLDGGSSCTRSSQCVGNANCVDSFCCDSACTGPCKSCNGSVTVGGTNGHCDNASVNTDPDGDCDGGLQCSGTSSGCFAHCTADVNCKTTFYCDNTVSGNCQSTLGTGATCAADPVDATGSHQCVSVSCVDSRCCIADSGDPNNRPKTCALGSQHLFCHSCATPNNGTCSVEGIASQTEEVQVSGVDAVVETPSVAVDDSVKSGKFLIAWRDNRDRQNGEIFYSISNGAQVLVAEQNLVAGAVLDSADQIRNPVARFNGAPDGGDFAILWVDGRDSYTTIADAGITRETLRYARVDQNGNPVLLPGVGNAAQAALLGSARRQISSMSWAFNNAGRGGVAYFRTLTSTNGNGNSAHLTTDTSLLFFTFDRNGGALSSPVTVATPNNAAVAVASDGTRFAVAYRDDAGAVHLSIYDDGTPAADGGFSAPSPVASVAVDSADATSNVAIAFGSVPSADGGTDAGAPKREYVVVWDKIADGGRHLFGSRYNATGTLLSGPTGITSGSIQQQATVAWLSTEFGFAYRDNRDSADAVYLQRRYYDLTQVPSSEVRISTLPADGGGNAVTPALVAGKTKYAAAWADDRTGAATPAAFLAGRVNCGKGDLGDPCAADTDCDSGSCADGVCCNSACGDNCHSCNLTVSQCSNNADCAGAGGCDGGFCQGARPGYCLIPRAQDTDPTDCGGYGCIASGGDGGTTCAPTNCGIDSQCARTFYCDTSVSQCAPQHSNDGGTCSAPDQCLTGNCVVGKCCDTSCSGTCQQCSTGTCAPMALGALDPAHGNCPCAGSEAACNSPPTLTLSNLPTSLQEATSPTTTTFLVTVQANDPNPGQTLTFQVSGVSWATFENGLTSISLLSGGTTQTTLHLNPDENAYYQADGGTDGIANINVTVSDGIAAADGGFSFPVQRMNSTPTFAAIGGMTDNGTYATTALSEATVALGSAPVSTFALSASDDDILENLSFSLIAGSGTACSDNGGAIAYDPGTHAGQMLITVSTTNQAPGARPNNPSMAQGQITIQPGPNAAHNNPSGQDWCFGVRVSDGSSDDGGASFVDRFVRLTVNRANANPLFAASNPPTTIALSESTTVLATTVPNEYNLSATDVDTMQTLHFEAHEATSCPAGASPLLFTQTGSPIDVCVSGDPTRSDPICASASTTATPGATYTDSSTATGKLRIVVGPNGAAGVPLKSWCFEVWVRDDAGGQTVLPIVLNVTQTNAPPALAPISDIVLSEAQVPGSSPTVILPAPTQVGLTVTDPDNAEDFVYTARLCGSGAVIPWVQGIAKNPAAAITGGGTTQTATLSLNPGPNDRGTYCVQVSASDLGSPTPVLTALQSFNVTISQTNSPVYFKPVTNTDPTVNDVVAVAGLTSTRSVVAADWDSEQTLTFARDDTCPALGVNVFGPAECAGATSVLWASVSGSGAAQPLPTGVKGTLTLSPTIDVAAGPANIYCFCMNVTDGNAGDSTIQHQMVRIYVREARGKACSADTQCVQTSDLTLDPGLVTDGTPASPFCVGATASTSGVCCDQQCNQACHTCKSISLPGVCRNVTVNTEDPGCGAYSCGADGNCRTQCQRNLDCAQASNYFCDETTQRCLFKRSIGEACLHDYGCLSNFCSDFLNGQGICCDSRCSGDCETCRAGTSPGLCDALPAGTVKPVCNAYTCDGTGKCRGFCLEDSHCAPGFFCNATLCVPKRNVGEPCSSNNQCNLPGSTDPLAVGFCFDGVCCSQACSGDCQSCNQPGSVGQCVNSPALSAPRSATSCQGAYRCAGDGTCLSSCSCGPGATNCTSAPQCVMSAQCVENQCGLPKAPGSACVNNAGCTSLSCSSDGFCCGISCGGACRSCMPPNISMCTNRSADTDPVNGCNGFTCDGNGSCRTTCTDDSQCHKDANGVNTHVCTNGVCVPRAPGGTACAQDRECLAGLFCNGGHCCTTATCGPLENCNTGTCKRPNGAACDSADQCASAAMGGACVHDNPADSTSPAYCCAQAQCGAGESCITGACKKVNGQACGSNSDCVTGQCADGVCCNVACSGLCSACNQSGKVGTCVLFDRGQDLRQQCGNYSCNGQGACLTTCAQSSDCKQAYYCRPEDKLCTLRKTDGTPCTSDGECQQGSHCFVGSEGSICTKNDQLNNTAGVKGGCATTSAGGAGTILLVLALVALLWRRRATMGRRC